MPNRPKYSRFRRLPGLYRIGEKKGPDPHAEPQLLSLYISGRTLDRAEALAMREGGGTVQSYCEELLSSAVDAEDRRVHHEQESVKNSPLKSLDELAKDPKNLAEWAAIALERSSDASEGAIAVSQNASRGDHWEVAFAEAKEVVLRHAGMGVEDPYALLPALRAGTAVFSETIEELLAALAHLETHLQRAEDVDRRLAYALHRLAFEGQVLLTDAYPGQSADPNTVESLRKVQELVDRVLSGEDIRYYSDRSHTIEP